MTDYQHEVLIRTIKCLDISLIGVYYLILAIIAALVLNEIFKVEAEAEDGLKKPLPNLFLKIAFQTSMIMLSVYAMRQVVKRIPFPLDGVCGFEHKRVKEINGAVIMAFVVITLQTNYGRDLSELATHLRRDVDIA